MRIEQGSVRDGGGFVTYDRTMAGHTNCVRVYQSTLHYYVKWLCGITISRCISGPLAVGRLLQNIFSKFVREFATVHIMYALDPCMGRPRRGESALDATVAVVTHIIDFFLIDY